MVPVLAPAHARRQASSHQASARGVAVLVASSVPSPARNSSRSPGSPVTGSRSDPAGGSGTISQVRQPGATVTSACPARASRSAAAGVDTAAGVTPRCRRPG